MAFELFWNSKTTLDTTMMMRKSYNGSHTQRICGYQQAPLSHYQSIGGVEKMETVER